MRDIGSCSCPVGDGTIPLLTLRQSNHKSAPLQATFKIAPHNKHQARIIYVLCTRKKQINKKNDIALQRHYTENFKQIFPEKELRGLSPNSYIHVSVSDLHIPMIGLPIMLKENRRIDRGNI